MTASAPERPRALGGDAHAPLEYLGRAGLVARGVVYGVIGILALEVALRAGGRTAGQRGALETIAHQTLGAVLLVVVAAGLAGYALWKLAVALTGASADADGPLDRIAAAAGAVAYALLCVTAVEILAGGGASGGHSSPRHATAGVLGWTGGPLLVGAAGLVLVGVGLYQGHRGLTRTFLEDSDTASMRRPVRRSFVALAVFGHLARAVTFILIGYGLLKAAADYSPRDAIGLDGALAKLAHASAGPLLLGLVAAGLLGFGLYSILDARHHRI